MEYCEAGTEHSLAGSEDVVGQTDAGLVVEQRGLIPDSGTLLSSWCHSSPVLAEHIRG